MVTAVVAYGIANLDHLLSRDGNFMPDGIYADFNTNKGRISVLLDYKKAPMTVANFIGLAEGTITNASYPPGIPFYKGSIWHRVVKGHVIQGGEPAIVKDPANSDVNSTGYEIPNEISDLSHNKAGMIGMANAVQIQIPASIILLLLTDHISMVIILFSGKWLMVWMLLIKLYREIQLIQLQLSGQDRS